VQLVKKNDLIPNKHIGITSVQPRVGLISLEKSLPQYVVCGEEFICGISCLLLNKFCELLCSRLQAKYLIGRALMARGDLDESLGHLTKVMTLSSTDFLPDDLERGSRSMSE
jgi:hypothetical protein